MADNMEEDSQEVPKRRKFRSREIFRILAESQNTKKLAKNNKR